MFTSVLEGKEKYYKGKTANDWKPARWSGKKRVEGHRTQTVFWAKSIIEDKTKGRQKSGPDHQRKNIGDEMAQGYSYWGKILVQFQRGHVPDLVSLVCGKTWNRRRDHTKKTQLHNCTRLSPNKHAFFFFFLIPYFSWPFTQENSFSYTSVNPA